MKYANSLKYIDGFKPSSPKDVVSLRRISEMCMSLGQINRGIRFIHVPDSAAGHGCAMMLESILHSAGHRVGRICMPENLDSRASVFVGKAVPSIDDYNKCVSEIKLKVGKNYQLEFLREEIIFVLSLLLCRLSGCEFIILEGTDKFDRVCTPYELTIIPTVYDYEKANEKIIPLCDSIRCGTREVVSGNQKSEVYNYISNVCVPSGQRLFLPAKAQFELVDRSVRSITFNYNGRDGFTLKTSSLIMRDCALVSIEAIMALGYEGIKIPMSAVISGLSSCGSCDSFEVISYTPTVIVDNSRDAYEAELMYKTFYEAFGDKKFSVCIPAQSVYDIERLLEKIPEVSIKKILVCGHDYDISLYHGIHVEVCRTAKNASEIILQDKSADAAWLCFGGTFGRKIKSEILKLSNY